MFRGDHVGKGTHGTLGRELERETLLQRNTGTNQGKGAQRGPHGP